MQADIIIVGQGLCGTWLSYECQKASLKVLVIDQSDPNSPSRLSAGIINPITGRRHVEVWLAAELLKYTVESYGTIGKQLGRNLIRTTSLLDHFPNAQMRDSFRDRIDQGGRYVSMAEVTSEQDHPLKYPFGIGIIDPVGLVDLPGLLNRWRAVLQSEDVLIESSFEADALKISAHGIEYKGIQASHIIFCDGTAGNSERFFPGLPFAPNKGEVLILDIPRLSDRFVYKHGLMLAPLSDGSWWAGSNYQWSFEDANPSTAFRESTEKTLREWLEVPFKVIEHKAGVRPATLERRPFVGFHPQNPRLGILNGMGTKGCSLAPYFARQLVRHLLYKEPIHPEASVSRFIFLPSP